MSDRLQSADSAPDGARLLAYEGQHDSAYKGKDDQGRHVWRLNQSRLKQVDVCPERGRRALLALDSDGASDSSAMGRACHSAVEMSVRDIIDGRGPWNLADMVEIACAEFDAEMLLPSSRWVKVKTADTIYGHISRCLTTWHTLVMPTLRPVAVEVNFGPLVIYEDDVRVIEVKGQIDYVDAVDGLGDWKTAGRTWAQYEHQRFDLQPTMYTWAAKIMGWDTPNLDRWVWHVLNINGTYQRIETTRHVGDWMWLKERMVTLVKMLEADLPEWQKNDGHWLCSPTWCPAWTACKGKHFTEAWPKPSEPR